MDKKELKFYEAPVQEIVNLNLEAQLLAGSFNPEDPKPGDDEEF